MRRAILTLLAAGQLAAAPSLEAPVRPPPQIVDGFLALCAPFPGQPEATLKAADAAGWAPLSRKLAPPMPAEMTDGSYRFRSSKLAMDYLYAGHGPSFVEGNLAGFCGIAEGPANPDQVRAAVEAWIGAPPVEVGPDGVRYYAFADGPDGHRAVKPDSPEFSYALRGGTLRFVIVALDREEAFVAMLTPKPPSA